MSLGWKKGECWRCDQKKEKVISIWDSSSSSYRDYCKSCIADYAEDSSSGWIVLELFTGIYQWHPVTYRGPDL